MQYAACMVLQQLKDEAASPAGTFAEKRWCGRKSELVILTCWKHLCVPGIKMQHGVSMVLQQLEHEAASSDGKGMRMHTMKGSRMAESGVGHPFG